MLDVRRLRLLRELSHRGTIAAVAEALAYTPSAVSQQLTALEREAGVALLERTGRRVRLTPAAVGLVRHAETVLAALAEAEAGLARARADVVGPLRIGVFPSAVVALLTPALVSLSTDHPAVDLMVTELDPSGVPDALRDGRLDVALVQEYDHVPAVADAGLYTEHLLDEVVHLADGDLRSPGDSDLRSPGDSDLRSPGDSDLRAPGDETTPGDLLGKYRDSDWIAGTPGTLCHSLTVRVCEAAGFTPRIRHHADDFGTVLALVGAGQGTALVPDLGIPRPDGARGAPPVMLTPLPIRRRTHLACRRGTESDPVIAAARSALGVAAARVGTDPATTGPASAAAPGHRRRPDLR
ncbi:LysR family transcriptional regulator [Gordonia soli]|uniref:Putative LysR family transcriptional regulator n=1 Tax=Gordonia soli NBRC 108243 TaxID=1223545 RepID=M0QGF0_9ACTN|nr:LysR family transcriptional regulator [Gordonia soli]GAC66472.1 putative LysR family transcriptional regulator [Gordonia soli NBRC 108243]